MAKLGTMRARKLIAAAEAAKGAGLERVLIGLSVRDLGPTLAHQLVERFQTWDNLHAFAEQYLKERAIEDLLAHFGGDADEMKSFISKMAANEPV